jgi:hypothetical protein
MLSKSCTNFFIHKLYSEYFLHVYESKIMKPIKIVFKMDEGDKKE